MQRCQDETMPHVMSGGKSSQFLFLVQNKKDLVSSCETATQAEKDIFLSSSVHLGSPQKRLESWGVKLGILSGFW